MKTILVIRFLQEHGYYFLRHGGNHDIYTNGVKKLAIPRHKDIPETVFREIQKEMGL